MNAPVLASLACQCGQCLGAGDDQFAQPGLPDLLQLVPVQLRLPTLPLPPPKPKELAQ